VHRDTACIEVAKRRRALERSLRTPVPTGVWERLVELAREFAEPEPMA
jgi:predicted RNA-binding protein YlxR (DUF448 family)